VNSAAVGDQILAWRALPDRPEDNIKLREFLRDFTFWRGVYQLPAFGSVPLLRISLRTVAELKAFTAIGIKSFRSHAPGTSI